MCSKVHSKFNSFLGDRLIKKCRVLEDPAVSDAPILEAPFKRAHVEEGEGPGPGFFGSTDSSNKSRKVLSQVKTVRMMIDC